MITLNYKDLLYDIEQRTFRQADARFDNPEARESAQIDNTESLNDMALRWCEEGCARLSVMLRDRLETTATKNANSGLDYEKQGWLFELKEGSWKTDEQQLAMLMHSFVVSYVLHKWALTYSPTEVSTFANEEQTSISMVKSEAFRFGTPKKKRNVIETDSFEPEISLEYGTEDN